jgi:hypothetical protein
MAIAKVEAVSGRTLLVAVSNTDDSLGSEERPAIEQAPGDAKLSAGATTQRELEGDRGAVAHLRETVSPETRVAEHGACIAPAVATRTHLPQEQAIVVRNRKYWIVRPAVPGKGLREVVRRRCRACGRGPGPRRPSVHRAERRPAVVMPRSALQSNPGRFTESTPTADGGVDPREIET